MPPSSPPPTSSSTAASPAPTSPRSNQGRNRRRVVLSTAVAVAFTAALVVVIYRRRDEFSEAIGGATFGILALATLLQVVALLARTEAWHICIEAAGGTVPRRALYRASGLGSLGSQLNSQVGTAARIAALRKTVPDAAPLIPALIAAEVPIIVIEAGYGAISSFTLVEPLGLPWWFPFVFLVLVAAIALGLGRVGKGHDSGWRTGLAVLAHLHGRNRTIFFVAIAICAQITRNWMMLHAIGIEASFWDANAILIAQAVLSQLPLGPGTGAAAVASILNTEGFVDTAAAGVLLTATGTMGALVFVIWAAGDIAWHARVKRRGGAMPEEPPPRHAPPD